MGFHLESTVSSETVPLRLVTHIPQHFFHESRKIGKVIKVGGIGEAIKPDNGIDLLLGPSLNIRPH
jgi:hypothetical protein